MAPAARGDASVRDPCDAVVSGLRLLQWPADLVAGGAGRGRGAAGGSGGFVRRPARAPDFAYIPSFMKGFP